MQSLSSFIREQSGGWPKTADRADLRIIEMAERAQERAMSPLERNMKSLGIAYADVLRDSAMVEAAQQLAAEAGDDLYKGLLKQRMEVLRESSAWLASMAGNLAKIAGE